MGAAAAFLLLIVALLSPVGAQGGSRRSAIRWFPLMSDCFPDRSKMPPISAWANLNIFSAQSVCSAFLPLWNVAFLQVDTKYSSHQQQQGRLRGMCWFWTSALFGKNIPRSRSSAHGMRASVRGVVQNCQVGWQTAAGVLGSEGWGVQVTAAVRCCFGCTTNSCDSTYIISHGSKQKKDSQDNLTGHSRTRVPVYPPTAGSISSGVPTQQQKQQHVQRDPLVHQRV
jgi:hypothetical protein